MDLETNPRYFFCSSTTGKFHAPVSSKTSITLPIGMVLVMMACGEFISCLTVKRSYKRGWNIILRTSSNSKIPSNLPSLSMTGNILRLLCAITLTSSPKVISGLSVLRSVSSTLSILSRVRTERSLLWVSSSPFCAKRMA